MLFRLYKITSILLSIVVVAINIFFIITELNGENFNIGVIVLIYIFSFLYCVFVIYVVIHMVIAFGGDKYQHIPWVEKYFTICLDDHNRHYVSD